MAARSALIVANAAYQDPKLRKLRAPVQDAEELGRVLRDPQIGNFEVEVSSNEPEHVVRRRIAAFFDDRERDDLLLLHISCHGLKDDSGRLFFAAADTEVDQLDATGLAAEFVNRQMTYSRSRRIVLLLDCCYSGAFARGMTARAGEAVDIGERFEGSGRAVLTASSAMEYSFEGEELSGEGNPSVFTSALVKGLETGEADRDGDRWVGVDELYDYVHDQVKEITPKQTPGKWVFDMRGELYIAKSRYSGGAAATEAPRQDDGGRRAAGDPPAPTAPVPRNSGFGVARPHKVLIAGAVVAALAAVLGLALLGGGGGDGGAPRLSKEDYDARATDAVAGIRAALPSTELPRGDSDRDALAVKLADGQSTLNATANRLDALEPP
ncbi:MAG TPA: caspase family protein, partial [Thermoleophilaceae bacterium]